MSKAAQISTGVRDQRDPERDSDRHPHGQWWLVWWIAQCRFSKIDMA
jgi:hypothetical protein